MSKVILGFGMGGTEIIIIIAIVVLLFGASAIPKLAKSIGQAKGEFEKGLKSGKKEAEKPGKPGKIEDKEEEKNS